MRKKILISILAFVVILSLILVVSSQFKTAEQKPPVNLSTNFTEELNPSITLDSVYWSFTGEATSTYNICLNTSRNNMYEFTMIGNSNISLSNFDGCYIKLNGKTTDSELRGISEEIKISSMALTHFENNAQLCCYYKNNSYCTDKTNLTVCSLNLTDVEIPIGDVQGCNYDSDCNDYCTDTFKGFTPNNCGGFYRFCNAERHCACGCKYVNYEQ